jgi:hypothetical protein
MGGCHPDRRRRMSAEAFTLAWQGEGAFARSWFDGVHNTAH